MIKVTAATPSISSFTWSTSEQVWPFEKDELGRTLYSKKIDFGAVPNNGWKSVSHGLGPNFDCTKVLKISGLYRLSTGLKVFVFVHTWSDASSTEFAMDGSNISLYSGNGIYGPLAAGQPLFVYLTYAK